MVAVKTGHIKVLSHTTSHKKSISQQPHSNLVWRNAPNPSCTYAAIPRARGILPQHSKLGRSNPITSNSDTWRIYESKVSEHNNMSHWDEATVRSQVSGQTQHLTTEYSEDGRNRTPRANVSLHIQKPKPHASVENKIKKSHNCLMYWIEYK